MSTIKLADLKDVKCTHCGEGVRLFSKGIICIENHVHDLESDLWLDTEASVTGKPREPRKACPICESTKQCFCNKIEAGFMMRESSGRK